MNLKKAKALRRLILQQAPAGMPMRNYLRSIRSGTIVLGHCVRRMIQEAKKEANRRSK